MEVAFKRGAWHINDTNLWQKNVPDHQKAPKHGNIQEIAGGQLQKRNEKVKTGGKHSLCCCRVKSRQIGVKLVRVRRSKGLFEACTIHRTQRQPAEQLQLKKGTQASGQAQTIDGTPNPFRVMNLIFVRATQIPTTTNILFTVPQATYGDDVGIGVGEPTLHAVALVKMPTKKQKGRGYIKNPAMGTTTTANTSLLLEVPQGKRQPHAEKIELSPQRHRNAHRKRIKEIRYGMTGQPRPVSQTRTSFVVQNHAGTKNKNTTKLTVVCASCIVQSTSIPQQQTHPV